MKHRVPTDWTPGTALAVVEALQSCVDAIWDEYGDELVELIADRAAEGAGIRDDDRLDLPF